MNKEIISSVLSFAAGVLTVQIIKKAKDKKVEELYITEEESE